MNALIRHLIESSFSVQPVVSANDAIVETFAVEHLHGLLGNRAWTELSVNEYRMCHDGLSFLTAAGLHYYLPGYMIAVIRDPVAADVIAETLISTLSHFPEDVRLRELGALMIVPQIAAVALWLYKQIAELGMTENAQRCFQTITLWSDSKLPAHWDEAPG